MIFHYGSLKPDRNRNRIGINKIARYICNAVCSQQWFGPFGVYCSCLCGAGACRHRATQVREVTDVNKATSLRKQTDFPPVALRRRKIPRNRAEKRLPGGAKQQAENPSVFAGYKATDLVEDGVLGAKWKHFWSWERLVKAVVSQHCANQKNPKVVFCHPWPREHEVLTIWFFCTQRRPKRGMRFIRLVWEFNSIS